MTGHKHIVKVCGMRDADNIRAVEALGIEWMGFICWPGSPRYVSHTPVYMPATVRRVGVFVDPTVPDVIVHARRLRLDILQLHGAETPAFCRQLRAALTAEGMPPAAVVKAFRIADVHDLAPTEHYRQGDDVDYFLFDTRTPLAGGSGRQFDWHILDAYRQPVPFLLSGGIGPDDARRLSAYDHPRCIGFDINSRFETAPAMKDVQAIQRFLAALRS